jgi:photosystem II stability/assembly factor-like uncharacterized protein
MIERILLTGLLAIVPLAPLSLMSPLSPLSPLSPTSPMSLPGALLRAQAPARATGNDPLEHLQWRELGPAVMGGRIDDLAVVEKNPDVIYVATASGGVWRTTDGAITWKPIFERVGPMSIGAIAVSQSDPSIVWAGTGEPNNRNTSSWGAGVYKSADGGDTWTATGLADTQHIGQIEIDPRNSNVVYVAALGHLWGANPERGLYKTTDAGKTWVRVLFVDDDTGVADVKLDPQSPDIVYASGYQRRRAAFGFNGGGPGSALYKSTDGGATWRKLTDGLPYAEGGDTGRIGIAVYRKDPRIVYTEIEHAKGGGLFRSNDRGETWTRMSRINPNPAYFSRFWIDPNNDLRVYVAALQSTGVMAGITVSEDGGKTFKPGLGDLVHPDFHAMWIDPANSSHMIIGVDGGVYLSRNGGNDWEHLNQIRIGQAYQVGYDMSRPYRVCAGFQDNGSLCGPVANRHVNGITNGDWLRVMAGDGFHTQPDRVDPNLVYVEAQEGQLHRLNLTTHEWASIAPAPKEGDSPYRFYWNAPVVLSAHDPKTLYFAAQYLFKSTNRGDSWTVISPDLTTGVDRNTLPIMGLLPKDQTVSRGYGVTSYPCIIRIAESPLEANVLWAGTDDGNLQVTRDGGKTWKNVAGRMRGVARGTYVSGIEASRLGAGAAYVVFDAHRANDFGAYILATSDYGETWVSKSGDLPHNNGSVRVVREDPGNTDLLFSGSEFGAFASFDRGEHWTLLGSNLPTVRVDDIQIHPREHDLILATHGRSLWVLDDITPLEQLTQARASDATLFDIRPATSWRRFGPTNAQQGTKAFAAPNPPEGALISYYLKTPTDHVRITVRDRDGNDLGQLDGTGHAGINRVNWDLRYPMPVSPSAEDRWATSEGFFSGFVHDRGPLVEPGEYTVTLHARGREISKAVRVEDDPAISISVEDRARRHEAVMRAYDLYRASAAEAQTVRNLRTSLTAVLDSWTADHAPVPDGLRKQAEAFSKTVDELSLLFVGRQGGGMNVAITYAPPPVPVRLAGALHSLQSYTAAPRQQDLDRLAELTTVVRDASERLKQAVGVELTRLNKAINDAEVPRIVVTTSDKQ